MSDIANTTVAEVTGKIMVVAIIILFLIVIFILFLHLYAKWFWWQTHHQQQNTAEQDNRHMIINQRRPQRHRFVFTHNPVEEKHGLDPSVLRSLPVLVFNRPSDGAIQECSVCLCELVHGDKTRMLFKCNHVFHVECIDMWFESHSTCPLCRNILKLDHYQMPALLEHVSLVSSEDDLSNVVECEMMGTQSRNVAESSITVSLSVMMSLENEENENKSVAVGTRFGSLKRMLSRDQKVVIVSSSSSSVADLEQGMN